MRINTFPSFRLRLLLCVLSLGLCVLCSCTNTFLYSEHLMGAKRSHRTVCAVADSPTNRAAVAEVVNLVAQHHQWRNDTEEWRARFVATTPSFYTNQGNLDRLINQTVILSFVPANSEPKYTRPRMYVTANRGTATVCLHQNKWSKKRSDVFAAVHETLVATLMERFGTNVSVSEGTAIIK